MFGTLNTGVSFFRRGMYTPKKKTAKASETLSHPPSEMKIKSSGWGKRRPKTNATTWKHAFNAFTSCTLKMLKVPK